MRRKQPDTTRRPEPRQTEPSGSTGQTSSAGFSPFAATDDRLSSPTPPPLASAPKSSGKEKLAASPEPAKFEFLSPINWRVPTRLVAILLIPVVIGLVFGGLRVNTSFDNYTKADHIEKTAQLAKAATELADALQQERDLSAPYLLTGNDDGTVAKLRKVTDQKLEGYKAAFAKVSDDPELSRRNAAFQGMVGFLPHLRQVAYSRELLASATQGAYSTLFAPLLAYDNSVGFGSSSVTSEGRAIYAISLAKAAASTQRALYLDLLVGIGTGQVTRYENQELIESLLVSAKLEQTALNEFNTGSTPENAKIYADALVAQAAIDARAPLRMPDGHSLPTMQGLMNIGLAYSEAAMAGEKNGKAQADAQVAAAKAQGLTPENWMQATSGHINSLAVGETNLLNKVLQDAADIKNSAQTDAIMNSAIVIAALALAGLLTGFIARSMILGMRTLNHAALEIANHRLPDLVDKLSKTDPERVDTKVEQIPLWGKDEIGEVARAFDQVHQQAVSLAAEQALLRGNVNAIFTNLSRRSQGLIQRQLALITDLENNEADPDQLENLFKLDHLATRMRRNGENLLVLSGEEPGRRWSTPVPLVDVLRAAASEVEQYERVELAGIPEVEVVGAAVTDLVHLLAELLENATTFSSPQTRVLVNATRLPDGRVLVEIHDKGIGLTAEDFAEINEKLAEPPTVDATISRRMGLFVVGRLSQRHDIRVQLRPSGESAGTTSLVMLPQHTTQMRSMPEPEEEFTVSRIFAEQAPAEDPWAPQPESRSAAELGFDDHLIGNAGSSGFSPALEAMQRSQRLEQQRRMALEAGPGEAGAPGEEAYEAYQDEPYQQDAYGRPVPAQEEYQSDSFQAFGQQQPAAPAQYAGDGYEGYQDPYGRGQYDQDGYGDQHYANEQYRDDQYAGYGQGQYAQDGYDGYQEAGYQSDQPSGHPYAPELPALPAAEQPGSGLPQRRPGGQLAGSGSAIGGQGGGDTLNWFTGARDSGGSVDSDRHDVSSLGNYAPSGPTASPAGSQWASANDSDWQRAEQLREPAAGGVTSSGLPRRVPKQNLVAGNAKPTPQDGPQVSRSPEEVRGRLTNLRRGVEQGRSAGGDTTGSFRIDPDLGRSNNGQHNRSTDLFGGSNHQER